MTVVNFGLPLAELASRALRKATDLRLDLEIGPIDPVCCFDVCEILEINTRFAQINMEGLYEAGPPPRIFVSSLRPLSRSLFTCGHELGHHVFDHGSVIDEIQKDASTSQRKTPEEWLADFFAAHFLMPPIGVQRRLNSRNVDLETVEPIVIHAIASEFGVGYETLVTHLAYSDRQTSENWRKRLLKHRSSIRSNLPDMTKGHRVTFIDEYVETQFLTAEVGQVIIVPEKTSYCRDRFNEIAQTPIGWAITPTTRGISEITLFKNDETIRVRTMPRQYQGLGRYRFLEDAYE